MTIADPDKYIAGKKAGGAVGSFLVGGLVGLAAHNSSDVDALDKSLLRIQDLLPGAQVKGLVLLNRVFVQSQNGGSSGREVEFKSYIVSLDLAGEQYIFSFKRGQ